MWPEPILDLGFAKVYLYGVMIAIGIALAFFVLYLYAKRLRSDTGIVDFVYYAGIAAIAVGFGSAALFQALYDFIENPEKGFHISGSITFIGGLIGGAACFLLLYLIFRRRLKAPLVTVLPIIPCMILVAHGFGRIGCFCAGCCYGKPADNFLGVQFPGLTYRVYPTQLYEAIFLLLMFAVCSYLLLRKNYRHTMSVYLISYGAFRFLIEFLRGDHRGELLGFLSPSQFWSILMIGIGVGLFFPMKKWLAALPDEEPVSEEPATEEQE